jgi:hypothetical protein
MHLGAPDTLKKFLRGNLWIIGADPSTLEVSAEMDWNDGTISTDVDLAFTTENNIKFKFTEQRGKSLRLILAHATKLARMRITGFTLEIAAPFRKVVKE